MNLSRNKAIQIINCCLNKIDFSYKTLFLTGSNFEPSDSLKILK